MRIPDDHLNWWLLGILALLAGILFGPRFLKGESTMPLQIGIQANARWDNSLYCKFAPNWGQDCAGGWLGLYVDKAGNKHPDAHYADLQHAIAGIPDEFGRPSRPPGYATFGHPKFRCYEKCGNGGWSYKGWP